MNKTVCKTVISVTVIVTVLGLSLCVYAGDTNGDDLDAQMEAAIEELEKDLEALRTIGKDETPDGEGAADKDKKRPWKRQYSFEYVFWRYSGEKPLPPTYRNHLPKGVIQSSTRQHLSGRSALPPEGDRYVFWVMQITYTIDRSDRSYKRHNLLLSPLHMLQLKKEENAEEAIEKVLQAYKRNVAENGVLRNPFVAYVTRKGTVSKFQVKKLAGPFDNPDEARPAVADFYFGLAGEFQEFGEIARDWQNDYSDKELSLVWDNPWANPRGWIKPPKKGEKLYPIFWKRR